MHRALAAAATRSWLRPSAAPLPTLRRAFASSPCSCQESSAPFLPLASPAQGQIDDDAHPPSNSIDKPHDDAPAIQEPPAATAAYSLPQDAFAAEDHPGQPASSSSYRPASTRPPTSKPRQRQFLSTAEAQAFADLLGEILPRSSRPPSDPLAAASASASSSSSPSAGSTAGTASPPPGLFDIFSPSAAAAAHSPEVASSVTRVQQALLRKVGRGVEPGSARWERKARAELSEHETLQLDRLQEQLATLRSDTDVLEWGLRNVFGFAAEHRSILVDPATLPVSEAFPSPMDAPPRSATTLSPPATAGPSSRLFPDLLHALFLSLRDTHHSPHSALSVFSLAASNPFSFIAGCTTALYNEVFRTRWAEGDVEALLAALEDMRAAGVPLDDRTRDLVSAVGQAMRIDSERADARVEALLAAGQLHLPGGGAGGGGGAGVTALDDEEREREVARRRFFSGEQVRAWGTMERLVEEQWAESERKRRERDDERWAAQEHARLSREEGERDEAERERPSLVGGVGGGGGFGGGGGAFGAGAGRRRLSPYDEDEGGRFGSSSSSSSRRGGSGRMTSFGWRDPVPERDDDGRMTLPKRPSFANPFKIRRKALTKAEKSAKDDRHPALWWKQ